MNNHEAINNSLTTIIEMLKDRNITINVSIDSLNSVISSNVNKTTFEVIIDNIKLIYYLNNKFKWSELKKIFENEVEQAKQYILIIKDKISQSNQRLINELNLNIQIFDIADLQFNITKHVLVPKHELINDENEIKDILDRYSLKTKFQLPTILKTDPIAKYYNLKNGDIVKITRHSPSSGEYIVYRCCL